MSETIAYRQKNHANLIQFASMLFRLVTEKYGGSTTLNELTVLNYGFVRHSRGKDISVTRAADDLSIPKSSVSRILTGLRSKGLVIEEPHPSDRRRRIFKVSNLQLSRGEIEIGELLEWCSKSENSFC